MSTPSSNTNLRATVALVGVLAMAFVLTSCGGSSGPSAQSLMNDTFSSRTPIERANLILTLSFRPIGPGAPSSNGLELDLSGPFQNVGPGKLPRFALTVGVTAGEHTTQAAATATGSQFFIKLGRSWFVAPEATYRAVEQGYAQATKSAQSRSTFSTLGIDPRKWLTKPSYAGIYVIEGLQTYDVAGSVDTAALLQDVSKLTQSAGLLGSSIPGISALTPIARAIHSARVEIYTGKSDHLLRSLELFARISPSPQTQALLNGASEAEAELTIVFNKLNKPQVITAPSHPKPVSQLLPALQRLLGSLQSVGGAGSSPLGG